MIFNKIVLIEREEERCLFKMFVRRRFRKVIRRNEDNKGFYLSGNYFFLNYLL